MSGLPDLMRRLDRKLDIQRGLSLTYDDLALLVATGAYAKLQEAADDEKRTRLFPPTPDQNDANPFIYFIQSGDSGPIKIGFAKDVGKRRTALQPSTHEQLHVCASARWPQWFERTLHGHFEPEHIRGEWFRPSPRLLAYIEAVQ